MKKYLACLVFTFSVVIIDAQQLFWGIGKNASTFDYKNSEGETLDNIHGNTYNLMELGYRLSLLHKNLHFFTSASYNRYGAAGSDKKLGNYFEWDVTYIGSNLGVDYDLYRSGRSVNSLQSFTVYLKGVVAAEILIHGTQTINYQVYNIIGQEEFGNPIFFLRGGAGCNYSVTQLMKVFFQYTGGKSMSLTFDNSKDKEKLNYIAHAFSVGLLLNLPSNKLRY